MRCATSREAVAADATLSSAFRVNVAGSENGDAELSVATSCDDGL
jgi:hypothetical protein